MPKKNTRYTVMPCGLKLRMNVGTGNFELVGEVGFSGFPHPDTDDSKLNLNIVASPGNLMALSAFFLARAQEAELAK